MAPNRPLRPRGAGGGGRRPRVVIDSGAPRPRPAGRPGPGPRPGGRGRRVVIDSGAARPRPDGRQGPGQRSDGPRPKQAPAAPPTGPATVHSGVTVRDLSQALGVPAANIIRIMMGLGKMVQITQS